MLPLVEQKVIFEKNINYSQIEGKAIIMIPKIGWVKVGAVELITWIKNLI
mgnify:CR=1 FL=1